MNFSFKLVFSFGTNARVTDVLWLAVGEVFSSPFGVRCLWLKELSVSLYKVSENQARIQL